MEIKKGLVIHQYNSQNEIKELRKTNPIRLEIIGKNAYIYNKNTTSVIPICIKTLKGLEFPIIILQNADLNIELLKLLDCINRNSKGQKNVIHDFSVTRTEFLDFLKLIYLSDKPYFYVLGEKLEFGNSLKDLNVNKKIIRKLIVIEKQ